MAGILDSDLMQFLVTPRAFMARRNAAADAQAFQGLLGTLQAQGPTQPGAGLLASREPDTQFWLKAAQIPGYQDIASAQLGYGTQNAGAMARQQQQQQFARNYTTADQQIDNALAERQFGWNQQLQSADLERKWYGTQASAGASGAAADLSRARLFEQQQNNAKLGGPLYNRLPPVEQVKARDEILNADTWAEGAHDVAEWARNRGTGAALPAVGTAEAATWLGEYNTSVKPMLMKVMNTGVLQGKEAEQLEELMRRPDDYMLTPTDINAISTMATKAADLRERAYRKYDLTAPPLKGGRSAAARTLSKGQPKGAVKPVTEIPAAGTIWHPVQRY